MTTFPLCNFQRYTYFSGSVTKKTKQREKTTLKSVKKKEPQKNFRLCPLSGSSGFTVEDDFRFLVEPSVYIIAF